jgi:hypothetical protein
MARPKRLGSAALAFAVAAASAGCAGPARVYRDRNVFDIQFRDGCPVAAVVRDEGNCDGKPRDCVRVKGGKSVKFVASPQFGVDPATGAQVPNEFELRFDPFARSAISSSGGETEELPTLVPAKGKEGKVFTFTVSRPKCGTVDPQIILD